MEKYPIIIRLASLFMPVNTVSGLHSMNLALQMVARKFPIGIPIGIENSYRNSYRN